MNISVLLQFKLEAFLLDIMMVYFKIDTLENM